MADRGQPARLRWLFAMSPICDAPVLFLFVAGRPVVAWCWTRTCAAGYRDMDCCARRSVPAGTGPRGTSSALATRSTTKRSSPQDDGCEIGAQAWHDGRI
jgi:hypothetical protein